MATPFTVTISYTKDSPDDCGTNVPGNWGVLDFDGGANSNDDTKRLGRERLPGPRSDPARSPATPGAFSNSLGTALRSLVTSGEVFQLPVYDGADFNGSNASFNVIGFVSVVLIDFKATGPEAGRWLEIEFRSTSRKERAARTAPTPGLGSCSSAPSTRSSRTSNCTDR